MKCIYLTTVERRHVKLKFKIFKHVNVKNSIYHVNEHNNLTKMIYPKVIQSTSCLSESYHNKDKLDW